MAALLNHDDLLGLYPEGIPNTVCLLRRLEEECGLVWESRLLLWVQLLLLFYHYCCTTIARSWSLYFLDGTTPQRMSFCCLHASQAEDRRQCCNIAAFVMAEQ